MNPTANRRRISSTLACRWRKTSPAGGGCDTFVISPTAFVDFLWCGRPTCPRRPPGPRRRDGATRSQGPWSLGSPATHPHETVPSARLSAISKDAKVTSVKAVLYCGIAVLVVSVTLMGWSGCSARTQERTVEAQQVNRQPPAPAQSAPPTSEPPSLETFSAFLDRA